MERIFRLARAWFSALTVDIHNISYFARFYFAWFFLTSTTLPYSILLFCFGIPFAPNHLLKVVFRLQILSTVILVLLPSRGQRYWPH